MDHYHELLELRAKLDPTKRSTGIEKGRAASKSPH
jgi:hypothetical protein